MFEALLQKGKPLSQAFVGLEVPTQLENARVSTLCVNHDRREINMTLVLDGFVKFGYLRELSRKISERYNLNELFLTPLYSGVEINEGPFLEEYKESIIEALAGQEPLMRYIFTGSEWVCTEDRLNITLVHGNLEMVEERKVGSRIERLLLEQTGAIFRVVFNDRFEEVEIEKPTVKAPPPTVKQPAPVSEALIGRKIKESPTKISDITDLGNRYCIQGEIVRVESRIVKNGKTLFSFDIYDKTGTLTCKCFISEAKCEIMAEAIMKGKHVKAEGRVTYDSFDQDITMMPDNVMEAQPMQIAQIIDDQPIKRVELHLHTKMSAKDGMSNAADLVNRAIKWGHKAIAITDHGVVQAFPESFNAKNKAKSDIKIIYGVEGYFVNDVHQAYVEPQENVEYVVFDIETTGLSPEQNEIIEIGAVKIKNGEITAQYESFIKPSIPVPAEITKLTGITDQHLNDARNYQQVLPEFYEFSKNCVLVGHNAISFDLAFIKNYGNKAGLKFDNQKMDTLHMARKALPQLKKHDLATLCQYFGITNAQHHRAIHDAKATAEIFKTLCKKIYGKPVIDTDYKRIKSRHIIILAQNQIGLKNLYKLITDSHINHFYKHPRILKSVLDQHREGLIIGTACEAGELYKAILAQASPYELEELVNYYDYLEIQPLGNNKFLLRNKIVDSEKKLQEINKKIVELGKQYNKPVVATGDVHFLDKEDAMYRRIIMTGLGFNDADEQAPLYLRTTQQMLDEMDYLDEIDQYKVVVENPNIIADMIEDLRPVPEGMCPPKLDNCENDIRDMATAKAYEIYGDPLPPIVSARLEKELNSIINNGFSVMYMIAHKLVRRSVESGYMVGSRGSVGSSLVAFLTGITEVNSLCAHYVCPNCKKSEFITDGSYSSGCDMADKRCECGTMLKKDGHDIPFETFLGFEGDKDPDIDLNFSGEYQSRAHKYTEELLGEGQVFRAGTISGVAEKTAYGFVNKYCEEKAPQTTKAERNRLAKKLEGIKQTTGQHPGGIIVVPIGRDIHEFTPVQHPADKSESGIITTHFDFHSIDSNLLKLDILGHDDPTVIKMLEDLTGVKAAEIPLDEPKTKSLFTSTKALNVTPEDIGSQVGTLGVPEFGTRFVRQMLVDTKPQGFADLVRISGLSHGTDVWLNNAKDLVTNGICKLSECICTRDDIMSYLILKGLPPKEAFNIMESVRKGKKLNRGWEDLMSEHDVPDWYINSCNKIQYMFPKAHAAAYVTMGFRIAYFKVYHPLEFYAAYFTVRADVFDYSTMAVGRNTVKQTMERIENMGNTASARDNEALTILELCNEFYARGYEFMPIDIHLSDATKFTRIGDKILPPLNTIPGLGANAAKQIVEARANGRFNTKQDLSKRAKVSKTTMALMEELHLLDDLPESDQIMLF